VVEIIFMKLTTDICSLKLDINLTTSRELFSNTIPFTSDCFPGTLGKCESTFQGTVARTAVCCTMVTTAHSFLQGHHIADLGSPKSIKIPRL
jgi:hypothetical protein